MIKVALPPTQALMGVTRPALYGLMNGWAEWCAGWRVGVFVGAL